MCSKNQGGNDKFSLELDKGELELKKFQFTKEIESERFSFTKEIEYKKVAYIKKSFYLDVFNKVALPIAIFALTYVTYQTNNYNVKERFEFDKSSKQAELTLKNTDYEINRKKRYDDFFEKNISKISSPNEVEFKKLMLVAESVFDNDKYVFDRLKTLHQSIIAIEKDSSQQGRVQKTTPIQTVNDVALNLKKLGAKQIEKGQYSNALVTLGDFISLKPGDAEAWNFLSYAQYQMDDFKGALLSVTNSLSLMSQSNYSEKVINLAIINKAKILCSQGEYERALDELNYSLKKSKSLYSKIKGDGELVNQCKLNF